MYIHSGHWRCCIPSSRTWTSNVRLKTPCRPSLLISDTSAGWNPVMLKAGPFPFLLFLPFFFTFPNVHNLLTLVTSRLMCLLLPPPPAPYTHTHFSVTPCLSIFFLRYLRVSGPKCSAGPSASLFQIIYESKYCLAQQGVKRLAHTADSCLPVTVLSVVSLCWFCAAVALTLKVTVMCLEVLTLWFFFFRSMFLICNCNVQSSSDVKLCSVIMCNL